jgi:hypothetical protein
MAVKLRVPAGAGTKMSAPVVIAPELTVRGVATDDPPAAVT